MSGGIPEWNWICARGFQAENAQVAMTREVSEIEVEVVEIDGVKPVSVPDRRMPPPPRNPWFGTLPRLRWSRWWPLWALLAVVLGALVLTFGLVVAVVIGVVVLLLRMFRALLG